MGAVVSCDTCCWRQKPHGTAQEPTSIHAKVIIDNLPEVLDPAPVHDLDEEMDVAPSTPAGPTAQEMGVAPPTLPESTEVHMSGLPEVLNLAPADDLDEAMGVAPQLLAEPTAQVETTADDMRPIGDET